MRYQITSTHGLPEAFKAEGMARTIVIESEAAHLPFDSDIDEGGAIADFNGFQIALNPGDRVKMLD